MGWNTTHPTVDTSTWTQKHIGFILDGTVLYASNADWTTQTKTDISSGVTATAHNFLRAVRVGSSILFYVNGTLKATHTTNLPTGTTGSGSPFSAWLANDTGVVTSRNMYVGQSNVLFEV